MKQNSTEKYDPSNIVVKDINFELMDKTYFLPLCRIAKKIVNHDAEDVVQELFEILWEKRKILHITGKLSLYLQQSVRNISHNYLAVKKKLLKYCEHIHDPDNWLNTQDTHDPHSIMEFQEILRKIDKVFENLPEECRKVFHLVWNEELKYREVAEKIGITVGAVGAQMNRAINKMREAFENEK